MKNNEDKIKKVKIKFQQIKRTILYGNSQLYTHYPPMFSGCLFK